MMTETEKHGFAPMAGIISIAILIFFCGLPVVGEMVQSKAVSDTHDATSEGGGGDHHH